MFMFNDMISQSIIRLCIDNRVATKIFEGFGDALFKEFIKGWESVSSVLYTRPGNLYQSSSTLGLDPISRGPTQSN